MKKISRRYTQIDTDENGGRMTLELLSVCGPCSSVAKNSIRRKNGEKSETQ